MGNILGEGFSKTIVKQIDQRQKIYGSINRDNEQLSFLNARTGWCKLVSGVSIDPQNFGESAILRNLNLPAGTALAKQFVLFNGVSYDFDLDNNIYDEYRYGIATDRSTLNNAAYGLGGLDYGIRPMPGIISAEIQTETRGSIKRATVRIQANNRQQFDIIDLLYMRLGYSMLLEWGNSSYFDNDGEYVSDNPWSLSTEFLSDYPTFSYKDSTGKEVTEDLTYESMQYAIQLRRHESCGNYDALFCKVVNFSWNFKENGTYDITLNLISLGDVIESLKSNTLLGSSPLNAIQIPIDPLPPTPTSDQYQKSRDRANQNISTNPKF